MKGSVIKSILGIVLILTSICGLFYWESTGRTQWTMVEVSAAASDIKKGTPLTKDLVKMVRVPKEMLVSHAIVAIPKNLLERGRANQFIPKNAQLSRNFFETDEKNFADGQFLFPLDKEWIAARSSTLRAGDVVTIYSADSAIDFGKFSIALVKDENENEVADGENGEIEEGLTNRKNATSRISHIEIWADLAQYESIRSFAENGGSLLVVQEKYADGQ